jgi:hypothetical protein
MKIKIAVSMQMLICIFILTLTANITYFIYWIYTLEQPVPIADHMDILINILRWRGDVSPPASFMQILFHNEHLILTTNFFIALDVLLFNGTSKFLILVSFVSQLITTYIFLVVLKKSKIEPQTFILTSICVVAMLLSGSQADNFLWGSQIQFIQVYMFACIALFAFVLGMIENRLGLVVMGFFSAILSTFSMANGGLVFVLFAIFSLWTCVNNKIYRYGRFSFISSLVFISIWLFLYIFYKNQQVAVPLDLAGIYPKVIFLIKYLGYPITFYSNLIGGVFGLIGFLLALWLNLIVISRFHLAIFFEIVLILILDFILLSTLVTSLGRTEIAPRYSTPVLIYWSIILMLCVIIFETCHSWRRALLKGGIFFCVMVMFSSVIFQDREIFRWRGMTDNFNIAQAAMISGIEDVDAFRSVYPWDNRVQHFTSIAKNLNLSIYSPANTKLRDPSFMNQAIKNLPSCSGEKTDIKELPILATYGDSNLLKGIKINGNFNNFSGFDLRDLVVTNPNLDIIGYGYVSQSKSSPIPWSAFAKFNSDDSSVNIFAFSKVTSSITCKVATISIEPKISFSDIGLPIENQPIKITGNAWFVNGVNPATKIASFNGIFWGSGGPDGMHDSKKGSLIIGPIIVPPNSRFIVIPAVAGPSKEGLDLRLLSAIDGATLNVFNLDKLQTHIWEPLVIDISGLSSGQEVIIEAADSGSGWGQWFGIGSVHIVPFRKSYKLKD